MTKARFLSKLLRLTFWHVAMSFLMNFIAFALAPLALGILMRDFFNVIEREMATIEGAWYPVFLMIILAIVRAAFFMGRTFFHQTVRFSMGTRLRRNLFDSLLRLQGAQAMEFSSGNSMSRFSGDVGDIVGFFNESITRLSFISFSVIALVIMAAIDLRITLFVVLPIAFMMAVITYAKPAIHKYMERQRKTAASVSEFIADLFGSIEAIQVANASPRISSRFVALNRRHCQAVLKDNLLNSILSAMGGLMGTIGIGLVLIVAGSSMRSGAFTLGDFALFAHYIVYLSMGIEGVGFILTQYGRINVSLNRFRETLPPKASDKMLISEGVPFSLFRDASEQEGSNEDSASASPLNHLEANNLSFRYPGASKGIDCISLSLKRGSFTVVTGAIGSGKTTLIRVLLGQLPMDKGTILWNGRKVKDPGRFFAPPHSAYCPQAPRLFSETLRENILLGLPEKEVNLADAIKQAVLEEDIEYMEDGMETLVGPKGVKLSGGQLQRAAAARMFVRNADLYVFDDLSSGLDVETERILWNRLFDQNSEKTCLVVSHRRAALKRADNILVMKDGHIEAQGKLDELLLSCEEMQKLWSAE